MVGYDEKQAAFDAVLVADHILRYWTPVAESYEVQQAAIRILQEAGKEIPAGPIQRWLNENKNPSSQRKQAYEAGIIATTDGKPPESFDAPAPAPIDATGQHKQYWVLSESERAKGFVRPVRHSYQHVGTPGPAFPLRDLTDDEQQNYGAVGYVKFETYPEGYKGSATGRFWTQDQLDRVGRGCGTVTTMGKALAETYAANPRFYGSTMCVGCDQHLRVGADGEFVWKGTDERVGT